MCSPSRGTSSLSASSLLPSGHSGNSCGEPLVKFPQSNVSQDYLKTIYSEGEWGSPQVSVSTLAARLGVSPSTASETVRRLAKEGLIHHQRYGLITLTERGRQAALKMVRRHRLIETVLVERLGYTWDEVHDEAEILEHAVSDRLVDRIDAFLGYPRRDPHGDPIPDAAGTVDVPPAVSLAEAPEGSRGTVVRLSDDEPMVLRLLAESGLHLDADIVVVERRSEERRVGKESRSRRER